MYQKEEIFESIHFLLSMNTPIKTQIITCNTQFKDLHLSRKTYLKFMRELELHFKIQIPTNTRTYIKTMGQLTFYVLTQVNKPYEQHL